MIKRPVLVEDDHEMLDRGRGPRLVLRATAMGVIVVPTEVRTAAIEIIATTAPLQAAAAATANIAAVESKFFLILSLAFFLILPLEKVGRDDYNLLQMTRLCQFDVKPISRACSRSSFAESHFHFHPCEGLRPALYRLLMTVLICC